MPKRRYNKRFPELVVNNNRRLRELGEKNNKQQQELNSGVETAKSIQGFPEYVLLKRNH